MDMEPSIKQEWWGYGEGSLLARNLTEHLTYLKRFEDRQSFTLREWKTKNTKINTLVVKMVVLTL